MRKLMMWVLFPVFVAAGAVLTVSAPAAAEPARMPYLNPTQMESQCKKNGGTFDDAGGDGDSMCIFPDGSVIVCYASIAECAYHSVLTPEADLRDGAVLGDMTLRNPPSPGPVVRDSRSVRSVLSR